jgi:hypothetical protein
MFRIPCEQVKKGNEEKTIIGGEKGWKRTHRNSCGKKVHRIRCKITRSKIRRNMEAQEEKNKDQTKSNSSTEEKYRADYRKRH